MIGNNIKKFRIKKGYSLREMGELLEISHQAVSNYEKNLVMPSSQMIIKIAKILDVKVATLFDDKPEQLELKNVHYRKKSTFTKKNQEIVESITKDKLSNYLQVLDLFNSERFPVIDITSLQETISNYEEIENAALAIRKKLNLGDDPISNLLQILEENGFIVLFIESIKGFDGKEGIVNGIPFIVLSDNPHGDRQRFSLAHELGHILLKKDESCNLEDEEIANRFAGSFLVPKDRLILDLGKKRRNLNFFELKQLKLKYKVSLQCLIVRACQCSIISEYEKVRLFKEISKKGWRKEEPINIEKEVSFKFEQIVCEAVSELYISESKGAEYLNISTIEFLERYMNNLNDNNK